MLASLDPVTDLGSGASLTESRRRLLDVVCRVCCLVALPVAAQQVWVNIGVRRWDIIALNVVASVSFLALALARSARYAVRALTLCALMAAIAGAAWFLGGFVLDAAALHLAAILLAALLLGRRAAGAALLFESAALALAAYGHLHGLLPTDPQIEAAGHLAENWATGGVLLAAVAIILGMGLSIVLRNVEGARRVAVGLSERLAEESEARLVEIGRREETQRQLVASQRREALALLAGGLAHDFNNLLTAVYFAFEQADGEVRPGGAAAEAITLGRTAADSGAALTRQLLAYSRGDPLGSKTPTDLAPVLRSTMALVRRLVPKTVELEVDVPEALPRVLCAPTQIQQVLLNLAVNAGDAMSGGGRLAVVARADGAAVELCVSDTGGGVDPEIADRIFEPLFSTKEIGKGTGLGLAVVASVVSDHGGTISVRSRAGEGTTFEVRLPLSLAAARGEARVPAPEVTRRRVLIVDDEEAIRLVAARMLDGRGDDIEVAASADEAMASIAARGAPDLVVTDLSMPGTSGAVFARAMLARHPALRVLVVSGYGDAESLEEILATGRAAVLVKPFTARTLREAVAGLGFS